MPNMGRPSCCWIIVTKCVVMLFCSGAASAARKEPDEQVLYNKIMGTYLSTVRPTLNGSKPLEVLFSMRLNQIVSLNERQQVLTTNAFIDQSWTDPALSWDPAKFMNVRSLRVPADQVWKPDTFIFNNVNNGSTGFIHGTYIQILHTGEVKWPVPVRLRSSCVVKIAYFPFDYQFCSVRFGSWIYNYALVDYTVRESVVSVDLSTYIKNSEWELMSMRLEKSIGNRSRGLGMHPYLIAVLYLKRNTFYYLFNIIVPCVMLSMLTLMTFWLPPTSGEKVTLGLSVFLAFSMFMLLIAEEVPASSDAVPVIGIYLCVVMTMTSLSVICAVLVTNLHNRGLKLRPAPRWLASLSIRYLAVPFCVSQDVQLLANTIHLSDYCQFFIIHDNRCERMIELNAQQSSGIQNKDTDDQIPRKSTEEDHTPLHQSQLQSPSKCAHSKLNAKAPSLQTHPGPGYCSTQNNVPDHNPDEEVTVGHFDQTIDSPLLRKIQPHYSGHYAPYKSVCTHDEDYFSGDCLETCLQQETALDAAVPSVVIQDMNTPSSSLKSTTTAGFLSEAKPDKFDYHYCITPCKTHETFCNCASDDEDVWVLRDELTSDDRDTSETHTAPYTSQCSYNNESDSETEVRRVLIPKSTQQNESLVSSKAVPSSSSSNSRKRRPITRQRRKRPSPMFENPKLVIKRARIMIAEWCTIAKVVDRILFTLSLFATIFAYVIILIIVPASNKLAPENMTFINSMKHLKIM